MALTSRETQPGPEQDPSIPILTLREAVIAFKKRCGCFGIRGAPGGSEGEDQANVCERVEGALEGSPGHDQTQGDLEEEGHSRAGLGSGAISMCDWDPGPQ